MLLSACASAPPITDSALHIRLINAEHARTCKFIQVVQHNEHIYGLGKTSTIMKEIGETKLRNQVVSAGGNALVITKDDSNAFFGDVAMEGEAYLCP